MDMRNAGDYFSGNEWAERGARRGLARFGTGLAARRAARGALPEWRVYACQCPLAEQLVYARDVDVAVPPHDRQEASLLVGSFLRGMNAAPDVLYKPDQSELPDMAMLADREGGRFSDGVPHPDVIMLFYPGSTMVVAQYALRPRGALAGAHMMPGTSALDRHAANLFHAAGYSLQYFRTRNADAPPRWSITPGGTIKVGRYFLRT